MKRLPLLLATFAVAMLLPITAFAQSNGTQFFRPYSQAGINVFETTKSCTTQFDGMKVNWGASFAQQFQSISHENTAAERIVNGVNANQLMTIGSGFNLATANLNLDAQLADGIRVSLTTYLSSRRHPEAWVKGGFFQIDRVPMFNSQLLNTIFDYTTLKIGHFQINYGDAQFRRSDNGNAFYNPFVGNHIMDAFTTEIGTEVYFQHAGFLAMLAATGGEIQGSILRPEERAPSYYGKIGVDRQVTPDLRLRLTGSAYTTEKSLNNTLYSGDRAGSRYYFVMENTAATTAQASSGLVNPGLRSQVTAIQINPFVKFHGLELFGVIEQAKGATPQEVASDISRTWNQYAVDAIYRFLPREQAYVGVRYNTVSGTIGAAGPIAAHDVTIDRIQIGGGWFVTPNILAKVEYVNQGYDGFLSTDIRNGGRFNGIMLEGVVSF
jgi:hypothetical protein